MQTLVVVYNPKDWPLEFPGAEVVSVRSYLTDKKYSEMRGVRVFNLSRSYRYQSSGYYVSLLAEARGHKPIPSITTIQDLKSQSIIRVVSEELDELIQKSLAPIQSKEFTLSIYFGRNVAKRYEPLSQSLFRLFQAPLLRAQFSKNERWELRTITPIATSDIPDEHWLFVIDVAKDYFEGRRVQTPKRVRTRYDLAILYNPTEVDPPSDEIALKRFTKAAQSLEFAVELITKDDYGRIAEFDALFIRETTAVHHHTYRFARRAEAEGLVVIDDPASIAKCTNKVYLAELLERHKIPTPKTFIVHHDNTDQIVEAVGLPCILKQPDSSFSKGVVKVSDRNELETEVTRLLDSSDLVIAQEFVPTEFDWRIGIFDEQPLYACKYYMARRHWQIVKRAGEGEESYGRVETLPVEMAPRRVVRLALNAANLIGNGLYGVDIKQNEHGCYVIEVNDNPTIEAGYEDSMLRDELYMRIMRGFLQRVEKAKEGKLRS
ncbi:MAG: RimK family protein [bacterium]